MNQNLQVILAALLYGSVLLVNSDRHLRILAFYVVLNLRYSCPYQEGEVPWQEEASSNGIGSNPGASKGFFLQNLR